MEKTYPFYDFCVPYNKNEKIMRDMVNELIDLGYKTIAIDQIFDHSKKDATKRSADIFPEPVAIKFLQDEFNNRIKILQRLTIIYIDGALSHAMNISLNLKKFNLIAGQPKTDAALTHCCTSFGGDIVTFDANAGLKLLVNHKAFQIAISRNMYFEIKYALAIRDSNNRKDMIRIAHNYCMRGKAKNVIFSSGADNVFELRNPYDVANLSCIFGLSQDQGKNAVDITCRRLFLHAESRRIGKTIMIAKGLGPIVFSDTSDEEDVNCEKGQAENTSPIVKEQDENIFFVDNTPSKAVLDSDDSDESLEHPNKKKKIY